MNAEMDIMFDPEAGEPLTQPPAPNIGGEGHPDYAGPNYVEREEVASTLKTLPHFGHDDD